MTVDVDPRVAEPRADNRVPEARAWAFAVLGAGLRAAGRWLVRGVPAGRARLSVPSESAFRVWAGVWQVSLTLIVVGTIVFFATEQTPWRAVAATAVVLGLLILLPALVVVAALEATVPPPRRVATPEPHTTEPLRAVADGVHVAARPLVFHGVRAGTHMTVLDTGAGLIVVSPVEADPAVFEAVRALGEVRWIVAPSLLHHLWVKPWTEAFPEASAWAGPHLAKRRPDVAWSGTIRDPSDAPWPREVVDVEVTRGHALDDELVLLHRPSRTLVVCDLVQHLGPDAFGGVLGRLGGRLALAIDRPGPQLDWKLTVRDPAALRASVERVLAWDFDRIVVAHGAPIEDDARAVFADAFAFVR